MPQVTLLGLGRLVFRLQLCQKAAMAHEARDEALSERAQHLLRILVESYIRDGQPVGSRILSRESGLQLSSATIRNVMADLEELGFVASPHTSAGPCADRQGLPLLRRHAAAAAAARRGDRVPRSAARSMASRESSRRLVATRLAAAVQRTQLAGVVTLPRAAAGVHHPDRVRRAVREPRAGGAGVQRPRGAEPHHPARAAFLARGAAARRELPQRAVPRPHASREVRQEILRQMRGSARP